VLCFHDIQDDPQTHSDSYTVSTRNLALYFSWLHARDYHAVSIDDIIESRNGGRPLPPRAILITFDDGLKSAYTRAFPLLEAFHYPAVVALVGSWLDGSASARTIVRYGDADLQREDFLTVEQIREM